jgi:hypothetical protein
LRCGKVLQLTGKETLALQIYERGLGKVKVGEDADRPVCHCNPCFRLSSDPGQLLQQMYTKLQQRQKPSSNLDPVIMLPNELALMVCRYLDMRDRV